MASQANNESGGRVSDTYWGMADPPRIRSITGVRIHQLTLPQSLSLIRSRPTPSPEAHLSLPEDGYFLGESSRLSASPGVSTLRRTNSSASQGPSRRERRISLSELESPSLKTRQRAGSGSTLAPSPETPAANGTQNHQNRTTRPRSRTLAGEALEHKRERANSAATGGIEAVPELGDGAESQRRQLARCFIAFRLPSAERPGVNSKTDVKGKGKAVPEYPATLRRSTSVIQTRPSRSTSVEHLQPNGGTSPGSPHPGTPTHTRSRTVSVNTLSSPISSKSGLGIDNPHSPTGVTGSIPKLGQRPPRLVRAGSEAGRTRPPGRPVSMISRGSYRSPHLNGIIDSEHSAQSNPHPTIPLSSAPSTQTTTPFFISPIHPPSSQPAFPSLLPESDFAPWLSTADAASQAVVVEVWYEDPEKGWLLLPGSGGCLDLTALRRVERDRGAVENGVDFSLAGQTGVWYAIPPALGDVVGEEEAFGGPNPVEKGRKRGTSVQGVMERSVRETRMKKGVGIGSLHQLVHGQMVVADTKQNIEIVKAKIDDLLRQDADRRALRREVNERFERVKWIQSKIDEVDKLSREVDAEIVLRRKAISDRRKELARAEERDDIDRSHTMRLDEAIYTADRASLLPLIHYYRAHHIQTLDALFPIHPLSPSILLYGILSVPLPIPSGKDPAPPITLPAAILPEGVKVDERTTAAALGYVAMVVHILGNLSGSGPGAGGLVYPVTCAGSRSLVRDVVSVMQGPRSFPLYTKGVERYRFDYAVFLLNTNIELLMQEANIRLVDRRHTLPNLKSLLLTLSSPVPPPPPPTYRAGSNSTYPPSGTTTYNNSRVGSRQTSYTFHSASALGLTREKMGSGTPASASSVGGSPVGSVGRGLSGRERETQSMSPVKSWGGETGIRGKRSHLSRQSWGGSVDGDEEAEEAASAVSRSEMTSEMGTEGC